MASLWRDPRTQFFVACFTDKDGRRLKKTTRKTNRKEAQKVADSFEETARKKQTLKSVRETISGIAKAIWNVDVSSVTLRSHIETWLAEKKAGTAGSTGEFYEQSTSKFLEFMGALSDEPIEEIDRDHVARFKNELSKTLAAKTVNHHLKCLRMVFKSAREKGLIDEDPAEFVETIKKKTSDGRRPFTMEEIKSLLAHAEGEWKSMILFGLYTGQRLADLAMLMWSNLDLEKGHMTLTTRKTHKKLVIPLAAPLLKHIKGLPRESKNAPVHPKSHEVVSKQKRSGTLSNQFSAILVAAGLRDKASLSKKGSGKGRGAKRASNEVSFHSLRHTAVSLLKEAGVPQAVVMEMIGHDSVAMSQHYTHVGKEALEKAAAVMPDLSIP